VDNARLPLSGVPFNACGLIASWVRVVSFCALFIVPAAGTAIPVLEVAEPPMCVGNTDVSKKTMPITAAIVLMARRVEYT
jgi:hypothetical protein